MITANEGNAIGLAAQCWVLSRNRKDSIGLSTGKLISETKSRDHR